MSMSTFTYYITLINLKREGGNLMRGVFNITPPFDKLVGKSLQYVLRPVVYYNM